MDAETSTPLRFLSFWSINDDLDEQKLCQQLDEMGRSGLDGAVFHPRFYPNHPPYLSAEYLRILSQAILHARDSGLAVWLYDENGWPSGTADGETLRQNPDAAGQMLALRPGEDTANAWHTFSRDGEKWHLRPYRLDGGIDYFNPEVCLRFLELTHDRYRDGLDPEAWAHVDAFFTDEPSFGPMGGFKNITKHGIIPWSNRLPEQYNQYCGRDLKADLPFVFFSRPDGEHKMIRIRFWEFLTDQFCRGFLAPYQQWCRREGKLFTGHVKGEEHPLFQVMMNGSCHQVYQHLDIPGIDSLERFPNGDFYPRQAGAAARQFGGGRAMAEVLGGSGWGTGPEDVERKLLWLANHGITDFVIHQYQYRLNSHALRDWPPSNPNWLNWREALPQVLATVRHKADPDSATADTLVVAPYRGIMASYEPWTLEESNIHNCAVYPDTEAGRLNTNFLEMVERLPGNHHFIDERGLEEHGCIVGNRLCIGKHRYASLVWADGCVAGDAGQRLSREFAAAGGSVKTNHSFEKPVRRSPGSANVGSAAALESILTLTWEKVIPPQNFLLLESRRTGCWWQTEFEVESSLESTLIVNFADDILSAHIDGETLDLTSTSEGARAILPPAAGAAGRHSLCFQLRADDPGPLFVWLKGEFRVLTRSGWEKDPNNNMLRTTGSWRLTPAAPVSADADFVTTGWPFANAEFYAAGTLRVAEAIPPKRRIRLDGIAADAVRIVLNDQNYGWTWGGDWSFELAEELTPGVSRIELKIIPSTFNHYGPHHYIEGDWHVISPGQVAGGPKNFADRPEAPEQTHDRKWRFHPLTLPSEFILISP